jgi:uncharacterized protein YodC (DUF2158 family)
MKVGDLVKLSSYGKNRQHNADCWGGWGFITEIFSSHLKYPIRTHWYKRDGSELSGMSFHPRELKKYKPVK